MTVSEFFDEEIYLAARTSPLVVESGHLCTLLFKRAATYVAEIHTVKALATTR